MNRRLIALLLVSMLILPGCVDSPELETTENQIDETAAPTCCEEVTSDNFASHVSEWLQSRYQEKLDDWLDDNDEDDMVTLEGDQVMYGDEAIDTYRGRILGLSMDLGTTTVVVELVDLLAAMFGLQKAVEALGNDRAHFVDF